MLKHSAETYTPETAKPAIRGSRETSLQIVLWSLWTLAVVGTAFWHWRADVVAERPVNLLGLVIYSVLAGLVGMLVITLVELWFEPLRFMD
ncbi:MAG TPA: hypothetical protein VFU22_03070 [Roseiflexaceae bacterium]|nr:hypothetical protein [Roseiflexaceae bacterium]